MLRRLTPYLIAAAVALTSTLGLVSRPAAGAPAEHVDYVVIAGAAGLRWDDVNPVDTPIMWRLAQHAAVGALSVTSAHTPTCPADGWLTLGAGNFAVRTDPTLSVGPDCPPDTVPVPTQGGTGAMLPDQETGVNRWNRDQSYGAQPGALAEAVRCTVAVGPGAAIAAARASGRVDRYRPALPDQPEPLLASCILSIVDLGTIRGDSPQVRQAAARQADQVLARLLAARPDRSLVIVAGLSDTDRTSRLHVAIADGPGYPAGWLTSSSTSRPGYVKLTDLAPSALTALDRPLPTKLFAGQPAGSIAGRPTDLATAVSRLSDADREAGAQRRVTGWFLTVLTASELLLFAAMVPFLRRARRYAGPRGPRPMPPRLVLALEVLLVAASLTLPAALATGGDRRRRRHRRGPGRQPVPGRQRRGSGVADRRYLCRCGDLHRRLPDLRAAGLGGAHRPRGDHRVRAAGPAAPAGRAGQPRPGADRGAGRQRRGGDPRYRRGQRGVRAEQPVDAGRARHRPAAHARPAAPVGRPEAAVRPLPGSAGHAGRRRGGRAAGRPPGRRRLRGRRGGGGDRRAAGLPGRAAGPRPRR